MTDRPNYRLPWISPAVGVGFVLALISSFLLVAAGDMSSLPEPRRAHDSAIFQLILGLSALAGAATVAFIYLCRSKRGLRRLQGGLDKALVIRAYFFLPVVIFGTLLAQSHLVVRDWVGGGLAGFVTSFFGGGMLVLRRQRRRLLRRTGQEPMRDGPPF